MRGFPQKAAVKRATRSNEREEVTIAWIVGSSSSRIDDEPRNAQRNADAVTAPIRANGKKRSRGIRFPARTTPTSLESTSRSRSREHRGSGGARSSEEGGGEPLGSRSKTARIRMPMATTQRANHEPAHRANQCRCHQPARGHFWDPVTLRCTNGSCTRTWDGQQVSPTDCEHQRNAPWEGASDA
jgi:hypothetical protein